MTSEVMEDGKGPILHVLVVGFHHKKGCQVEYSFPPLVPGAPNECPPGWKYLPTLALPDGSHNFDDDTAFFHLPSLTNSKKTIYGISCFRQIPVEKLKNRTDDITRGTVQKSVCVLSSLPLYGHIEVKMSLITHAYFEEGDFSKVSLLEDTYHHLNACLLQNNSPLQNFVGLSVRDFILQWRHKAVLLYKLLLLERRLVFFKSPVQPLCTTILTLLSLHPGMIEQGLEQSACIKLSRPMSPMPNFEDDNDDSTNALAPPASENTLTETDFSLNVVKKAKNNPDLINSTNNNVLAQPECLMNDIKAKPCVEFEVTNEKKSKSQPEREQISDTKSKSQETEEISDTKSKSQSETEEISDEKSKAQSETITGDKKTKTPEETEELKAINDKSAKSKTTNDKSKQTDDKTAKTTMENEQCQSQETEKSDTEKIEVDPVVDLGEREEKSSLPRDSSMDTLADASCHSNMTTLTHVNIENCGIPLPLFTKGYLCLPYLSLPYIDLLGDVNVRGYVVGATNVLFKQKRQLADVLIEIDGARIESQDPDLRRQLHLTTEDLRFADFVVKHVSEEKQDVFLDGVGWEGGDEWIRAQFRVYLLCLLRTSLLQEGSREIEHFNASFMSAWKETHNYKMWFSGEHPGILEVNPGHPFAGQLSVADMKLRFAHTMQNTESGRKINQAMASTGRAVATTGRAVGGAISQAKGALSSWWSNLLVSPDNRPAICDGDDVLSNNMQESCQNVDNLIDAAGELENNKKNNPQQQQAADIPCELVVNKDLVVISNGDIIGDAKSEHPERISYEVGAIHTV